MTIRITPHAAAFACAGLAALALPAAAAPQAGADRCWVRFTEIDRNDDGQIGATEAERHRERMFEIDKDKDGAISRAEFESCVQAAPDKATTSAAAATPTQPSVRASNLDAFDGNGDGTVTLAEFMATAQQTYEKKAGNDGAVTLSAYQQSPLNVLSHEPSQLDWNGDRKMSPNEAAVDAWNTFVALDRDEDGKLAAAEWENRTAAKPGLPAAKLFALIDLNDDGQITPKESAKTWELARAAHKGAELVPVWVYHVYVAG